MPELRSLRAEHLTLSLERWTEFVLMFIRVAPRSLEPAILELLRESIEQRHGLFRFSQGIAVLFDGVSLENAIQMAGHLRDQAEGRLLAQGIGHISGEARNVVLDVPASECDAELCSPALRQFSIGIAAFPGHANRAETLIEIARNSLTRAVEVGGNRIFGGITDPPGHSESGRVVKPPGSPLTHQTRRAEG